MTITRHGTAGVVAPQGGGRPAVPAWKEHTK